VVNYKFFDKSLEKHASRQTGPEGRVTVFVTAGVVYLVLLVVVGLPVWVVAQSTRLQLGKGSPSMAKNLTPTVQRKSRQN
jgi:hypothetical protein